MARFGRRRVLLADDHPLVLESIAGYIEKQLSYEVVAKVEDSSRILESLVKHRPDIVLLDYAMPGHNTFDVAITIKRRHPEVKVVFLTGVQSSLVYSRLFQSDVDGVLSKEDPVSEIANALTSVMDGGRYISDAVVQYAELNEVNLSRRELQVLDLMASGMQRKEIAQQLSVSIETVKTHRRNIMVKMRVDSFAELIQKAGDLNLLS